MLTKFPDGSFHDVMDIIDIRPHPANKVCNIEIPPLVYVTFKTNAMWCYTQTYYCPSYSIAIWLTERIADEIIAGPRWFRRVDYTMYNDWINKIREYPPDDIQ